MKNISLILVLTLTCFCSFSQSNDIFQMKKTATGSKSIEKKYRNDTTIDLSNLKDISSLSISGKIKLNDSKSLIRVLLETEAHIYLVYEAFTLIADKLNYSIDQVCEETSILDGEYPQKLIIVVRNAEFKLNNIYYSDLKLDDHEKRMMPDIVKNQKKIDDKYKTNRINKNNAKKNKTWIAESTEMSQLPFEKKMTIFGGNYDFLSGGFEYYQDGIFSFEDFEPLTKSNLKSTITSNYVSEFDWRDRHGQDWITSIKDQSIGNTSDCGSCYAFCAVATTEAMINIYHNNSDLDVNLSEQHVVSCSYRGTCDGGQLFDVMPYMCSYNGVVVEDCWLYSGIDEPCANICEDYMSRERISVGKVKKIWVAIDSMKSGLINHGPLASGISNWGFFHAMALVGYKEIEEGDEIKCIIDDGSGEYRRIESGDSLIGETYWIFKNSYGTDAGPNDGYFYAFMNPWAYHMYSGYSAEEPTSTAGYRRECTDNDNDGYFWWGIGSKPSTCPVCSPDEPDGDDSNPNLAYMDSYGNIASISEPYKAPNRTISSNETWTDNVNECGDIVVTSSGNLSINGSIITLNTNSSFEVALGGTLIINEGIIQ